MWKAVDKFHGAFDEQATLTPTRVATVSWGRNRHCCTYAEVRARSQVLAAGLAHQLSQCNSQRDSTCLAVIALEVPRTHPDFLPLLIAASRANMPFVLLSTDLPDKKMEKARTVMILELLQPLVVVSSVTQPSSQRNTVTVSVESLAQHGSLKSTKGFPEDKAVLCLLVTGGTHQAKLVQVTHAMLLHERTAYHDVWSPQILPPVILGQTSVFWGASALGQLSITLAYGGTIVWTDATDISELHQCIREEKVSVLGVVPDMLNLLTPEAPAARLPHIEVVFTWGERLPRRVAEHWRSHPKAVLRELLIATEYWLCLWADPLSDGTLRAVRGTDLLVIKEGGGIAEMGQVGELCISGHMVMQGYYRPNDTQRELEMHNLFFTAASGATFFRTRDLVEVVPRGVVYKGRMDMMAKDKGQWVDLLAIEDRIGQFQEVKGIKVVPDPVREQIHVFVALDGPSALGSTLESIRVALPTRAQLWLVPQLPRHPVTSKVDMARLLKVPARQKNSWPLTMPAHEQVAPLALQERLATKLVPHIIWTLITFGTALAVADTEGESLKWQTVLAGAWLASIAVVMKLARKGMNSIVVTVAWLIFISLSRPMSWSCTYQCLESILCVTYGWLALIYAEENRSSSWIGRAIMAIVDEIPFHKLGLFILLSLAQWHLPAFYAHVSHWLLLTACIFGMLSAALRRRLLAWPIFFWTLGIGHHVEAESRKWTRPSAWWKHARWDAKRLAECFSLLREGIYRRVAWTTTAAKETSKPETVECADCPNDVDPGHWFSRNLNGHPICSACGSVKVEALEIAAQQWLHAKLTEADVPVPLKRRRTVPSASTDSSQPTEAIFEVHTTKGWSAYDARVTALIQEALAAGRNEIEFVDYGFRYIINFDKMIQFNVDTKKERTIRHTNPTTLMSATHDAKEWTWHQQRQLMTWWWYNRTLDILDITEEHAATAAPLLVTTSQNEPALQQLACLSQEEQMLCNIVAEIEPLLQPVHRDTALFGLDSLRVARLTHAIRLRFGCYISAAELREAATVAHLAAAILNAPKTGMNAGESQSNGDGHEFAVWSTLGHHAPMGDWIVFNSDPLDHAALLHATQQLVERHPAFRTVLVDPHRYLRFVGDAAAFWPLYGPLLENAGLAARMLRRCISWGLRWTWPRMRCHSRHEMYNKQHPGDAAPLDFVRVEDGQTTFEKHIARRRYDVSTPGAVVGFELVCHLADAWKWHRGRRSGGFVILRLPDDTAVAQAATLAYVDTELGEWGPILTPTSDGWQAPPSNFASFFFVPLNTGSVAWLRLHWADELRVCYRCGTDRTLPNEHLTAFRTAPPKGRQMHEATVVSLMGVSMFHSVADGYCQMPLVRDLLLFYDAARKKQTCRLAPLPNVFEELERRLLDTIYLHPSPMRASFRGCWFEQSQSGFGHSFAFEPGAVVALSRASAKFRIPLDITFLGLIACAMARADGADTLDFTLYAPMRDGVADGAMVGLFADWRDLSVSVDKQLATVLGTVLQVSQKIQRREWTVFNQLCKPDSTIINVQTLDLEPRSGFVPIGECFWRGDQLNQPRWRRDQMSWVRQAASFNIWQQDKVTWWIGASVAYNERPAYWMRQFAYALRQAMHCFVFDGLALVHCSFPDDLMLLRDSGGAKIVEETTDDGAGTVNTAPASDPVSNDLVLNPIDNFD